MNVIDESETAGMDIARAPQSGRPRILLSEDDPAVRRSIQLLLVSRGYDVRAYTSASALLSDPLALAAKGLIADYRMPDVDGITMLKRLRAAGWNGAALLITGFPARELVRRAASEGFHAVLEKPLKEQELLQRLATAMAANQGIAI
jgi:FixJ family two-component response regulator